MTDALMKAVGGWAQAVSILQKTTDSLEFALAAIDEEFKRNLPGSFPHSPEKAMKIYEAMCNLKTAQMYCRAQAAAGGDGELADKTEGSK